MDLKNEYFLSVQIGFPQVIYKVNEILIKISMIFFPELGGKNLKTHMKKEMFLNNQSKFEQKNKAVRI